MVMNAGASGSPPYKLKIIRDTVFNERKVKKGEIVIAATRFLVNIGKAVDYEEEPKREKISLNK